MNKIEFKPFLKFYTVKLNNLVQCFGYNRGKTLLQTTEQHYPHNYVKLENYQQFREMPQIEQGG